jgi:predicted GNAT family acetyltransferase
MNVQHSGDDTEGKFFLEENGQQIGEIYYYFSDKGKLVIQHTEVSPEHEGKGLGKQLVKAVVEFAREKGVKIIPVCPYAKAVLLRTKEYADVLS